MDALTTARRVLRWSLYPAGSPPLGTLAGVSALASPDEQTKTALRHLAGATAARCGAGPEPLGDSSPIGLDAILIASAIGGRGQGTLSQSVLGVVRRLRLTRRSEGWAECLARHAVVFPAVSLPAAAGGLPEDLADSLAEVSPLTMVLRRPPESAQATARATASRLLDRPRGTQVLVGALARPSTEAEVLAWRWQLLEQLRQERTATMLDVYVAALLWHRAAWDVRIQAAHQELSGRSRPSDLTIATLRYWLPLALLRRDEQREEGLAARILGPTQPGAAGTTLRGRLFLRFEDYGPIMRLIDRHESSLLLGVT
jgi:hypothetical protein